jgi:hydrogenase large subunit
VHAVCSVRAVENALGIVIPPNAQLIRNLIAGAQFIQDHVIHFYHLHALDWVDIISALSADPAATSRLAQSISDWPNSSPGYFRDLQNRLTSFASGGQLGPFTNGYWGHPAYKLPPEANLMAVAHYLEALDWQREFIKVHAILGGKNPHLQTYLVGGMACPVDLNSQSAINDYSLGLLRNLFSDAEKLVKQVYLPDVLAVAPFYLDWAGLGEGVGNFLSYGEWPLSEGASGAQPPQLFLPGGVIFGRDLSQVEPVDQAKVTEYVTHSWYSYGDDQEAKHPYDGETRPNYTGPKPPYQQLSTDGKYSWIKAPRYDGKPMEVGPLSRMLVAYASGHKQVRSWVDAALGQLKAGPEVLFSTLGRIAARCIETVVLSEQMLPWTDQLAANIGNGDLRIQDNSHWDPSTWPAEARGYGLAEAPRGALGHWVQIKGGKIVHYQIVVPSTWNGSPRDASGQMGPFEASLPGTPVADPAKPLEILRTIHSFDPCMACAVHVLDTHGGELARLQVP